MMKGKILIPLSLLISVLNILLVFFLLEESICTINEGVGLGILFNSPTLLSSTLLLLLILIYLKSRSVLRYNVLSIAILGTGNLVERIVRGHICDYIDLFGVHVNLVDIGITTVVLLSLIYILKETYADKGRDGGK